MLTSEGQVSRTSWHPTNRSLEQADIRRTGLSNILERLEAGWNEVAVGWMYLSVCLNEDVCLLILRLYLIASFGQVHCPISLKLYSRLSLSSNLPRTLYAFLISDYGRFYGQHNYLLVYMTPNKS